MTRHILLLEDDLELSRLIKDFLQREGMVVTSCTQAHRAQMLMGEQQFDLLLCDVNLPGKNGFEFVAEVRGLFHGPILFITAQTELSSQLKGFALGAQDYLLKPINPPLLLAKIQVFFQLSHSPSQEPQQWSQHNLQLDVQAKTAVLAGTVLQLTSAEFKLLSALMAQFGKVVSREWLFQQHLGREYDGVDRTMDGRASRLRKKLQVQDPLWNIHTSWGEGYFLAYGVKT